jgi:UPF0755 protein
MAQYESQLNTPLTRDPNAPTQRFTVNRGEGAAQIGRNLVTAGLIRDAEAFRVYARYSGLDAKLQAGVYLLSPALTPSQIAARLTNAGANTIRLLVREGWRLEEIVDAINRTPDLPFSGSDFLAVVKGNGAPGDFLRSVGAPATVTSLEGFLYPATYELPLDSTAISLRDKMLASFNQAIDSTARAGLSAQGLTLYQAVTLASIVEREAVVADERPVIAGVYLNRLRLPMTLDADPTIQYALGNTRTAGIWWPQITLADYRGVSSPYNTYVNIGLPPGPIANPRRESILAVISPQASPYLFFRASCKADGRHVFAKTFQEHLANACSN